MALKILQININHSWEAQDLFGQRAREIGVAICAISEPRRIPTSPYWFGSIDCKSAVFWLPENAVGVCKLIYRGKNFVLVKISNLFIYSCYISPNSRQDDFRSFLIELGDCFYRYGLVNNVLCGDFNAKSYLWGSGAVNFRGVLLEEWAASMDLRILNTGGVFTCIRPQGSSVVDLTWISPNLYNFNVNWRVLDEETLSDHLFILISIGDNLLNNSNMNSDRNNTYRRWNLKKIDLTLFTESIRWACLLGPSGWSSASVAASWVVKTIRKSCDLAAPRAGTCNRKKNVYWWSEEIAVKRRNCNRMRRRYLRIRNRSGIEDDLRRSRYLDYKTERRELRKMIDKAKIKSWFELIDSIKDDPWGLPYKLVLGRLRRSSPSLTETLEEDKLEELIGSLFPRDFPTPPSTRWAGGLGEVWREEWDVSVGEVGTVVHGRRKKGGNVAPGPDGIKFLVLRAIPLELDKLIACCFTLLLRIGHFPDFWKRAKLVLIPKASGAQFPLDGTLPKARPICLLDEIGKAFERVIVNRILGYLECHPESDLSSCQFGFRRGLSTNDAIVYVKKKVQKAVNKGSVVILISLDIANAFNSLPWRIILDALRKKGIPTYLIRIIDFYLSDRFIEFPVSDGTIRSLPVLAGVPQGSILGPLLWNISYDSVLQTENYGGCSKVCYADDTLLVVEASNVVRARIFANLQLVRTVAQLRSLGLGIAADKTEAVLFSRDMRRGTVVDLDVDGTPVSTSNSMKYLGVIIDYKWCFDPHFEYIENKVASVTRALGRLMPNLRGPTEDKRVLFYNVISSVVLYAAPVWSEALLSSKRSLCRVRRMQRVLAIRVISAYRTVSLEASSLLARRPPLQLVAAARRRAFVKISSLRKLGWATREEQLEIRSAQDLLLIRQWKIHIGNVNLSGSRVREAIRPVFGDWVARKHGALEFHLTQLLTGHGCFNEFLYRIGKCPTPNCARCGSVPDTVDHTIADCPAWDVQRGVLRAAVGEDLSLSAIIRSMVASKEGWRAVRDFARAVLRIKEEEERVRQRRGLPFLHLDADSSSG